MSDKLEILIKARKQASDKLHQARIENDTPMAYHLEKHIKKLNDEIAHESAIEAAQHAGLEQMYDDAVAMKRIEEVRQRTDEYKDKAALRMAIQDRDDIKSTLDRVVKENGVLTQENRSLKADLENALGEIARLQVVSDFATQLKVI